MYNSCVHENAVGPGATIRRVSRLSRAIRTSRITLTVSRIGAMATWTNQQSRRNQRGEAEFGHNVHSLYVGQS